jgi:DNA-binding CsgD family transcriptional regulator
MPKVVRVPLDEIKVPEAPVESGRQRTCCRCGKGFYATMNYMVCMDCRVTSIPLEKKPLSAREKQVIGLVAKGLQNKDIAAQLCLSEGTIKEYLNRIFRKVGVDNRTTLAVYSIANPDKL